MGTSQAKDWFTYRLVALASAAVLATAACAAPTAAPTAAPAKPVPTAAAPQPVPPTASAKVEAPTARPAATAAPAAKPTEKPAAKAAEFDEKAVGDFYKGKTVRIVVGFGPGGTTDTYARLVQKVLPRYVPGNPNVVVENKPGGGSMLAANTVYNAEPRDGTVIVTFSQQAILEQVTGGQGVQFDAAKFNWLVTSYESFGACAARTDSGVSRIQDIIEGGKELTVASYGKTTASYQPPAVMNVGLGTKFKIVTGYESGATQRLAVQNKEVQGFCTSFEEMRGLDRELFEGATPVARIIVVTGASTPDDPLLRGVPAAETLARTEEARALLKAVHATFQVPLPHALPPEVPKDRVQALRRAYDRTYADAEFRAAAEKAQVAVSPKTGEQVTRIIQELLSLPPATLDKLKKALE